MAKRSKRPVRVWVIGGAAVIVVLILGANGHMLHLAVSSQPGCLEATVTQSAGGADQVLRPAKAGC